MNEELEKNFFEEIKPLIDEYIEYTNVELPDYTAITRQNENKVYSNNEEGRIEQSLDEEINKLIASKMEELRQVRASKTQEKQEAIYTKTQEFVSTNKEEMDKQIEEKKKELQEKEKELEANKRETEDLGGKLRKLKKAKEDLKDVDEKVYKAIDDAEQEKMNTLKDACKVYNKILEEHKNMKEELQQLEEQRDGFEKIYSEIDFESEKGISDIVGIIESRQEKEEPVIEEEEEISDDNSNAFGTSENNVRITSLKDIEEKRQKKEQEEEKNDNTKFPRVNPDEVDVEKPKKVLTVDDLKDEEEQNNEQDNDEIADEEDKRRQEEEKMWEENKKQQKSREEKDKRQTRKIQETIEYNEKGNGKETVAQEIENHEKEQEKIRHQKEELFNSREAGYQDLLKDDYTYQALKDRWIRTYSLDQLRTALEGKTLIDIYRLYVKQMSKSIENSMKLEEGLTKEEIDAKMAKRLDDEELKRKLYVRLEMLKDRKQDLEKFREQSEQHKETSTVEPYKETKIVIEPYKNTVTVYLKGHTEPFTCDDLKQRIEDGKNLAKSDHIQKGLIRGIKKGDAAILSILQEIEIVSGYELIEGYTWMYAKPNDIEKDKHLSPIDKIVYDFSNENKIQDKEMIKTMQKYAKEAEMNGVAESIGRKKGIFEKAKDGVTGLVGKIGKPVLALGEGIKNIHPIEGVAQKINNRKYYTPKEVDESKATSTYNEWRTDMNAKEKIWREKMGEGAPTLEDQADFMKGFNDRSEQETESERDYDKRQDEFYSRY